MRLVVTGGGTGGHVYPALEVARLAGERGAELIYFGSVRGQEGKLCEQRGILFKGFPSEPLYSLRTARGWRSLSKLMRARKLAKKHLTAAKPDAVFSTGGYSAGPVLAAARSLGLPYVIHDGNSVPGRANRMFGRQAKAFLCTFFATERFYKDRPVVRTGQPIRKSLREAAEAPKLTEVVLANALNEGDAPGVQVPDPRGLDAGATVLVLGGSQGALYLNCVVPRAVAALDLRVRVIHSSGPTHFAETTSLVRSLGLDEYRVEPYLDAEAIADAYCEADLVVCRSGGTLAELAMFGLPSVLVPLPSSADDHQRHNAREFADMAAASIVEQDRGWTPTARSAPVGIEAMSAGIAGWLSEPGRGLEARRRLKEWDVPDATDRIVAHIEAAAR